MVERAERLHRQFFRPALPSARQPSWEPPVDIYETDRGFSVVVALPGVEPDRVEVLFDAGTVIVAGERRLPAGSSGADIHRLEIPHGRFERRIRLPTDHLEVGRHDLSNGCLVLILHKI